MPSQDSGETEDLTSDVRSRQPRLRPLRVSPQPSTSAVSGFLSAVYAAGVSRSTYEMFRALAAMPAAERLRRAAVLTVNVLFANPEASKPMQQALEVEEYASYCEVQRLDIPVAAKVVADTLLCMQERAALLVFFRPAFRELRTADTNSPKRTP